MFLPPYSPDYNPIEHDFANIKRYREYHPETTLHDTIQMLSLILRVYCIIDRHRKSHGRVGSSGKGVGRYSAAKRERAVLLEKVECGVGSCHQRSISVDNRSDVARGKRFDDLFESNRLSIAPREGLFSRSAAICEISFYRLATGIVKPFFDLPVCE